jgi:hypothetical protein
MSLSILGPVLITRRLSLSWMTRPLALLCLMVLRSLYLINLPGTSIGRRSSSSACCRDENSGMRFSKRLNSILGTLVELL